MGGVGGRADENGAGEGGRGGRAEEAAAVSAAYLATLPSEEAEARIRAFEDRVCRKS